MTTIAMWGAVAALTLVQQTDTTFEVRPDARLDLENFSGEVIVRTWERTAVRVEAEHSSGDRIEVKASPSVVRVRARAEMGPPPIVNFRLTVPAKMGLDLAVPFSDVTIEGADGDVSVQTVEGAITLRGGQGFVSLQSVEGGVQVEGARGRVRINAVDGDVRIVRSTGEVIVQAVDGDILLEAIDSDHVEATTVDGVIRYTGTIRDGGRYRFATHDGDLVVTVPPNVNATFTVATFSGEFESEWPVTLTESRRGKRFSFILGSGSAKVELQAFDGLIQLRRSK